MDVINMSCYVEGWEHLKQHQGYENSNFRYMLVLICRFVGVDGVGVTEMRCAPIIMFHVFLSSLPPACSCCLLLTWSHTHWCGGTQSPPVASVYWEVLLSSVHCWLPASADKTDLRQRPISTELFSLIWVKGIF